MKKEDLLKAVGGADDRFIAEAAPKKKILRTERRAIPCA